MRVVARIRINSPPELTELRLWVERQGPDGQEFLDAVDAFTRLDTSDLDPELDELASRDVLPCQEILDVYGNIAALDAPNMEIVGFVVIETTFLNWFNRCELNRVRAAMRDYFACRYWLKVAAKVRRRVFRAFLTAVRKLVRRLLGAAGTAAPPAVLRLGRPPPTLRTSGGKTDVFPALC